MASVRTVWSVAGRRLSAAPALLTLALLVLGCGAGPDRVVAAPGLPQAPVLAQVSISGVTRRLTTDPGPQFDPALSGDIVVYTDFRNGNADIYYTDLATNAEVRVTTSTADDQLNDVSGNTIVYTDFGSGTGGGDVKAFDISTGTQSPVAALAGSVQWNPALSGSIAAWEDTRDGNFEIYAKDVSTGGGKRLTNMPRLDFDPAVSGTKVVYVSIIATTCQIFVTDFATLGTTQLTSAAGCHLRPDISGNTVVYQGNRGGSQDIFVYDLATASETRLLLPGVQRNPNVSGDWVAYEDVSSGSSDIKLYHIPTGTHHDVAVSTSSNEFLNDIDGNRVVYTSDTAGNLDIWLFEFPTTLFCPVLTHLPGCP